MKKRRVKTGYNKKGYLYDALVCYFIVELVSSLYSYPFMLTRGIFAFLSITVSILPEFHNLTVFLGWCYFSISVALIYVLFALLISFPFIAIYFGIKLASRKHFKEDTIYNVEMDISYYRDVFKDISPTTISLLMDLKLEYSKDTSATLLKLYYQEAIDFIDRQIIIKETNDNKLKNSEHALLNILKNDKISRPSFMTWERQCIDEAVAEGYVRHKNSKTKVLNHVAFLALLFILNVYLFKTLFLNETVAPVEIPILEKYDEEINGNVTNIEIVKDPAFISSMINLSKIISGAIAGITLIIIPIYGFVYIITYKMKRYKLKRTKLGNELTEKIVGLKNFIHDFSLLSEANKEHLKIWQDYLIYAIVLEENSRVVNEIGNYYKIDLNSFQVYK